MKPCDEDINELLNALNPTLKTVKESLDRGIEVANAIRYDHDLADDSLCFAMGVRWAAYTELRNASNGTSEYTVKKLSMCGIEITAHEKVFRIRKSFHKGATPPLGVGVARQMALFQMVEDTGPIGKFLLVDWDVGNDGLSVLAISEPSGSGNYFYDEKPKWRVVLRISGFDGMFVPDENDDFDDVYLLEEEVGNGDIGTAYQAIS